MMIYRNQPNKPTKSQITQKIKDASSTTLDPNEVRFSQNTIFYNKIERGTDVKYTYNDLVLSMKKDGWKGDSVDVVKMNYGQYTSMDNTRIAAAREARIDVKANIHNFNDPLSSAEKARFEDPKKGFYPTIWGKAIQGRINKQSGGGAERIIQMALMIFLV